VAGREQRNDGEVQSTVVAPTERPVEGFELRSPQAADQLVNVHVPQNCWFSAGNAAQCDSGTCQVVPVSRSDHKFNTALEWETSPEQAAERAKREGKLVFLIHVSGNFAQPGFT
jgi:hypothetical protein